MEYDEFPNLPDDYFGSVQATTNEIAQAGSSSVRRSVSTGGFIQFCFDGKRIHAYPVQQDFSIKLCVVIWCHVNDNYIILLHLLQKICP